MNHEENRKIAEACMWAAQDIIDYDGKMPMDFTRTLQFITTRMVNAMTELYIAQERNERLGPKPVNHCCKADGPEVCTPDNPHVQCEPGFGENDV